MSKTIIPPKPEGASWTDDQWKAIWAKDQDVLVAAAAGSGKTAVLVNRIIEKIMAEEDPLNVDELLVATFTNASAAEMKHRIGEALEKAIQENPGSQHLRKQLSLLNKASISTLHSFCLEVIRTYYYETNLDPGFRIADSAEAELIRDEVIEELFEEQYGDPENERFFRLVDAYTGDRDDTALQTMIRSMHLFSQANPDPDAWLEHAVSMYELDENASVEDLPFIKDLYTDISLQLQTAASLLNQALELSRMPGGPAPRAENFLADLQIVSRLEQALKLSWSELYEVMQQDISFSRAKSCKGDDFDKAIIKQADDCRKKAKKVLDTLKSELFERRPEQYLEDMRNLKEYVRTLADLVMRFDVKFKEAKLERNLVDFSDLEHYCLQILGEKTKEGLLVPSKAALGYRSKFKEVLVDEYQDTNLVQESIIKLVTADGEAAGNLFMVGDVKQVRP